MRTIHKSKAKHKPKRAVPPAPPPALAPAPPPALAPAPAPAPLRGRERRRARRRARRLPPPDPATRVELDRPDPRPSPRRRRSSAGLIVIAGLSGLLLAVASKFVEVIQLPSSSELSVAIFGVILIGLGLLERYRRAAPPVPVDGVHAEPVVEPEPEPEPVVEPVTPVDLPSLSGEIAGLLAHLRREYGLAYRTTTWLDEVLPTVGFVAAHPELVRDLLAVSALDAGGIRADVAALTEVYPTEAIVAAGSAVLAALTGLHDAYEQSDASIGALPRFDPPTWPSVMNQPAEQWARG